MKSYLNAQDAQKMSHKRNMELQEMLTGIINEDPMVRAFHGVDRLIDVEMAKIAAVKATWAGRIAAQFNRSETVRSAEWNARRLIADRVRMENLLADEAQNQEWDVQQNSPRPNADWLENAVVREYFDLQTEFMHNTVSQMLKASGVTYSSEA